VDQAQQLHLRAALLKQVLVEQELLIGKQLHKTATFTAVTGEGYFVILQVVHLHVIYQQDLLEQ
jgi:hypothetical protein